MTKRKKAKKNKAKSILSRQKPKRSKKKTRKNWRKIALTSGGVVIVVAISLAVSLYEKPEVKISHDFSISLKSEGNRPLSDKGADTALAVATSNIGNGSDEELRQAAKEVQILGSFESVSILKTSSNRAVLTVKQRQPLLNIKADRLRYLTESGAVYGRADLDSSDNTTLAGIFSSGKRYRFAEDRSLIVTDEERSNLTKAIKLFKSGKTTGFSFENITFKKYRGFSVHLTGSDIEVLIGHAPFDAKLTKLRKILAHLEKKGSHAERIELDYEGKAFIKERKM